MSKRGDCEGTRERSKERRVLGSRARNPRRHPKGKKEGKREAGQTQ